MSAATLRLIRMRELRGIVGLGHSRIYELVAAAKFPAPVRLSDRAVAWRSDDILAWIDSRQRVSRKFLGESGTDVQRKDSQST